MIQIPQLKRWNCGVSHGPWRQRQMRVLFVLSTRRAFRWRTYEHTVVNYAGVRAHWFIFRCCHSLAVIPGSVFLNPGPSLMLAFLVVTLPGERRQRRPGPKTWRLAVLAEGVSCRTVGALSLSLSLAFLPPLRNNERQTGQVIVPLLRGRGAWNLSTTSSPSVSAFGCFFLPVVVKKPIFEFFPYPHRQWWWWLQVFLAQSGNGWSQRFTGPRKTSHTWRFNSFLALFHITVSGIQCPQTWHINI